jgi:hypothetical protein
MALMIPASAEYLVPGADDETIFADIVTSIDRDANTVRQTLQCLHEFSKGIFADAPVDVQRSIVQQFRDEHPSLAAVLVAVTARCYYRDDRVMRSLGMEPRPPFPKGFEVESGDWSLLDPVRARPKIYRDV